MTLFNGKNRYFRVSEETESLKFKQGALIFRFLWSPGVDSKELIPPAYVALPVP